MNSLEDDSEGPLRVDSTSSGVKVELSPGDPHPAETEIAQTQDPRAVGDDDDLGRDLEGLGVVGEDLVQVVLVVNGEIKTLGTLVDLVVLLARLADSRGVDDGSATGQLKVAALGLKKLTG